jgi:DNA (cytosine-5)-methyltransferase 1
MTKPRMLDLFSGAGGCARGYQQAGFHVTGIDIKPQPRYAGDVFIQADALEYLAEHGHEFDAIHASPPCQAYSVTQNIHGREYPELVEPMRAALNASDKPYVIENVVGAPLHTSIELCGLMFGLQVYRHRRFESNVMLFQPAHQRHVAACTQVGRRPKDGEFMTVAGHFADIKAARIAMQIPWMTRDELAQAIPPAYTKCIGDQVMAAIQYRRLAA